MKPQSQESHVKGTCSPGLISDHLPVLKTEPRLLWSDTSDVTRVMSGVDDDSR